MLNYVNSVINSSGYIMKTIKVFHLPGLIIKKLGLTKLYYWFNK